MPNVGGPTQAKRQLLMSVIHSRLLYGATVWSDQVLSYQKSRNVLLQAQRCVSLKIARCYRTVSEMAALVLAKMPPVTLMATARKRIATMKKAGAVPIKNEVMSEVIQQWQVLWTSTTKATWTRRVIPDVTRWWQYGPKEVSFHMAQALTGHGCFQHYLWKKCRTDSPACPHCPAETDDVEHTVFVCAFWCGERKELEESLGRPVAPEDVTEILCGPMPAELPTELPLRGRILAAAERRRAQFTQMVESIMGSKEELERARQQAIAAAAAPAH